MTKGSNSNNKKSCKKSRWTSRNMDHTRSSQKGKTLFENSGEDDDVSNSKDLSIDSSTEVRTDDYADGESVRNSFHQGKSSLGDTGVEWSGSECDSVPYDLAPNHECSDFSQTGMVNYTYQNAMSLHTNNNLPQPTFQNPYNQQQMPIAVPIVAFPQYNPQLPFPDRSGNIPQFNCGVQNTVLQAPLPVVNQSVNYPAVYVSPVGLITVLLRYDVAVEMTADKNIRVVNHRHKAVAACSNRGNTNCAYHVAAKVYQEGAKTEAEVFGERRARMQSDGILFSSGSEVYLLDENHIIPSHFCFNDMSKDISVNILFGPGTVFSNDLLVKCEEITKSSRYYYHKNGSATVVINNIKIHQDEYGDVHVVSGPKYISTSPIYGNIYLHTHFVEISIQVNWNVLIKRGNHKLSATYTNFAVNNGQHEGGFNQFREVFSRVYNPTISEFESWLPSLTFLCQGLPQARNSYHSLNSKYNKERNCGDGNHIIISDV